MKKINEACNIDSNNILREIPIKHSNKVPLVTLPYTGNIVKSYWNILTNNNGSKQVFPY